MQSFTATPGSFLERGMYSPHTEYVLTEDEEPLIIGKVTKAARNRFKWCRYAKPIKVTTKAKAEPKIAESHFVPRRSSALWAVKLSHHNASKGGATT